ncbi:MAG TPA: MlaD family protein [Flavobacteriaceae bacterium]|nr:MlaD family protein [Flavobacteriaceae bacterium]
MEKSTSQKIKVGIFVVVGTLLLTAALFFIGSRQHLFSKTIKLYADFQNVSGLQLGNNVRYSGINVGTVTKIEMKEVGKVTIEMSVEEKSTYFIKKNAVAAINSDGLVGSMVVNIVPGEDDQQAENVVSGDYIESYQGVSTQEMIRTLDKTNKNTSLLSEDLLKITDKILNGEGTLGTLINDTIMSQDIRQAVSELKETSQATSVAMAKINRTLSKINYEESAAAVILSDTVAANQIKTVFENLEKSSKDINAITENVDQYITEIKSGEGALNHLTQDENFVKELDSTLINIKEASHKLNQNMEALQHNFLFRRYFRKLEKQKKKEGK